MHFTTTKAKLSPELGIEGVKRVIDEVRANGVELPIVAIGGVTENDIEPLLAAGVNGIAVSGAIINAEAPVELTSKMIERLLK